jgi:hypothetical protein
MIQIRDQANFYLMTQVVYKVITTSEHTKTYTKFSEKFSMVNPDFTPLLKLGE